MNRLLPKAISFDIYGTIIDWEGGTVDCTRSFSKSTRSPVSLLQRLKALGKSFSLNISAIIVPSGMF